MMIKESFVILSVLPFEELQASMAHFSAPDWNFFLTYETFFHKLLKRNLYKYDLVKKLVLNLILKIVLFFSLTYYK